MIRKSKEILLAHNLKPTTARLRILDLCLKYNLPLDAEWIANHIGASAHLATIYRNLETFTQAGILSRVDFADGKTRYEYLQNHHHHAVCEGCGKIEDVQDTEGEISAIEARVGAESGFAVTRHIMELFGLCNRCRQKGI